ncbi:hypothetical protein [Mitsuaria sp. 7]|uniref:hypothetical protein n=1 Tax=Mitsuaria sp. 7 TaxID=1658665 RepID=UPI0007DCC76B|nr:hypothetical protein [Mitsuaria sp. 7]ANH68214.1 hypothetical protein ABE85_12745 [Mitsuaria sp. 7]
MLSFLGSLHLGETFSGRSHAHAHAHADGARPDNTGGALTRREALHLLSDIVETLATRPSMASPGRLFAPDMLAHLGDLLESRHDAQCPLTWSEGHERSPRIGCDVVLLFTHVLSQGFRSSQEVLTALTTHHGGRAPFLLRLASAAVHDLPLSVAMCELLTEFSHAVGRAALIEALLTLDSPTGMRAKYTSFLGLLIGDGVGEGVADGAVYAIGRLDDERLLPDRGQVVHWRSHWGSRRRWEKQERFVQLCKDLRQRPHWPPPARPTLSFTAMSDRLAAMSDRLAAMLGELSGRSRRIAALSTDGSCLDRSPRPPGPDHRR